MKRVTVIFLCILALLLGSIACDWDPSGGDGWTPTEGSPATDWGAQATRGAEEFHAQLTAIERDRLTAEGTEEP